MEELGRLVSYTQNVTCALPGRSQAHNASLDVVVQLLSRVQLFVTPWTAAYLAQTHVH